MFKINQMKTRIQFRRQRGNAEWWAGRGELVAGEEISGSDMTDGAKPSEFFDISVLHILVKWHFTTKYQIGASTYIFFLIGR